MRQVLRIAVFTIISASFVQPAYADADPATSFSAFAASVRSESNTDYATKVFWQQWRGRSVTWSGVVSEVRAGSGRAVLYLAAPLEPVYRGYNIVAVTRDTATPATLQKGVQIQVSGLLHRYSARPGQAVVVTLKEAQIGLYQAPKVQDVPAKAPPPPAPPKTTATVPTKTDCATFIRAVDPAQVTELAARTNWSTLKLYNVTWTAVVAEVKGGHGGAEIFLACEKLPLYRGYNIILSTRDRAGAATLNKGQRITFTGTPHRYTYRPGVPTVVTIREGLLVQSTK